MRLLILWLLFIGLSQTINQHCHIEEHQLILNLVQMFTDLFNIKHKELEDSQRHITVGLDKLRETVIQVDKLQGMLSEKESILKIKDKEAKEMLNKLLTDQNEAERKQEFSVHTG